AAPDFYENYVARRLFTTSATRSYQSALKASGPLFSLPAGAVELTAGVSGLRSDRYRSEIFGQYQDGLTWQPKIPSGSTSDVASSSIDPRRLFVFDSYAGYAEVVVP